MLYILPEISGWLRPRSPCFYPHSEWAALGARCMLGFDLKPRSVPVTDLGCWVLLSKPTIGIYLGYRDDAHLEKRAESGSAFPRLGFIPLRYDGWLPVTVRESAALLRVSRAVKWL